MAVYDALISGARVRLRPILMTALTTSFALLPLAVAAEGSGGLISAELATVVIGGLMSSTGPDAYRPAHRVPVLQREPPQLLQPHPPPSASRASWPEPVPAAGTGVRDESAKPAIG